MSSPGTHRAEISRRNPTCFLFLIDQSQSMREPMGGGHGKTKAQAVADAINNLLYTLVLRCVKGANVLDRFQVGVLGYGARFGPILGGALAGRELVPIGEIAKGPVRVEQRPDPSTGQPARFPIWFEPVNEGRTPMCQTLRLATSILDQFLGRYPHCYPPMVINMTDGEANDGDPEGPAMQLRQLASSDGNVLLFNVHVSKLAGSAIEFPDQEAMLPDKNARLLFRMSSLLPPPMWAPAAEAGFHVTTGTRGFAFNADLASVIRFLNIGTVVAPQNVV